MVMSLIESLTRIKNAVYGREVREAIHDGVFRANQIADGADAKADKTQIRQDAVEDFNNQVIQEMTDKDVISAPEIIQMRDGEATASARLDRDFGEVYNKMADNLDILNQRSTHVSILEYIEDTGGELDITNVLKTLIDTLPENTTLYLPSRDATPYVITEKIIVDRQVFIKGDYSGRNGGTLISATGNGGFEVRTSYLPIDGIDLYGTKNGSFVHRTHLGNIGIDLVLSESWSSGGAQGYGVKVRGFNIGIAMRPVEDGTWAGAHRNFFNWNIRNNEVGLYAIDGATQNNFFGGQITNNTVHGVFTENEMYYSNLEFFGTILEFNGTRNVSDPSYKEHGIYAGKLAKVKLTGAYVEKLNLFASDGGMILMVNTHINQDVSMYATRGGDVDIGNSIGSYEATRTYSSGDQLRDALLFNDGFASGGTRPLVNINLTGASAESARTRTTWFMNRGVPIKNIKRFKIRFKFKVETNPGGVQIQPIINGESSTDLGNTALQSIPMNLFTFPEGTEVDVMFYYTPRVVTGFLSSTDTFNNFQLLMTFSGDKSSTPFKAVLSDVFIKAYSSSPLSLYDPTYASP